MSSEEPPTKKAKTTSPEDWKDHTLNIEEAIVKDYEASSFNDIAKSNIQVLQGIGPKSDMILEAMKLETVKDLADYKYFKMAKAIQTLAKTEGKRLSGSTMNADLALDKEFETKSFKEVLTLPLSALQGLTGAADSLLGSIGIKTIDDLASCRYFHWAQAICDIAEYEETATSAERKAARAAKQLS